MSAHVGLLKWGQPRWRAELLERHGVDYARTPAEDFATGLVTYRNPESGQETLAQFTVSWMYDKQGLRLLVDGIGPGYALEANSLRSPLEVFIGDAAAASVADAELALEKATASRGLLAIQPNEPDLYGYTDENVDALAAFRAGRSALLDFDDGLEIVRLTMAAYMSAEQGRVIDLTDPATLAALETTCRSSSRAAASEVLAGELAAGSRCGARRRGRQSCKISGRVLARAAGQGLLEEVRVRAGAGRGLMSRVREELRDRLRELGDDEAACGPAACHSSASVCSTAGVERGRA